MRIVGPETRRCPPEFQARLTRMFGKNQFGDPVIKIVWGQSEFHRMGNTWRDRHGNERRGYRNRYLAHGQPCWTILRWRAPRVFGSPNMFYSRTFDDVSGLYIMGEYSWRGRYEVMQPLIRKEFVGGKLVIEHFPLSHVLIDRIIPLILEAEQLTVDEKRAAHEYVKKKEHDEAVKELADRMVDAMPHLGPISYNHQGIRTSLIDRKMAQISRKWDLLARNGRQLRMMPKGIMQGRSPFSPGLN